MTRVEHVLSIDHEKTTTTPAVDSAVDISFHGLIGPRRELKTLARPKRTATMEPKDMNIEQNPFQLSAEFEKAIIEREIKRRELLAELQEPSPGPICEPDEEGACPMCSG